MKKIFIIGTVVLAGGFFFITKMPVASAATVPQIQVQLSDWSASLGCDPSTAGVPQETPAGGGAATGAGDSNDYQPNCAQIWLSSTGPFTQNFRLGIRTAGSHVSGTCADSGYPDVWGPWVYTPWASQAGVAGGWSGWISGGDTNFDVDCMQVTVDTTGAPALPAGEVINNVYVGVWVGNGNSVPFPNCSNPPSEPGNPSVTITPATWSGLQGIADNMDCGNIFLGASTENAQGSGNNIPTSYTPSQTVTTNGGTLYLQMKNIGELGWGTIAGQGIAGSAKGTCQVNADPSVDSFDDAPSPTAANIAATCTVTDNLWSPIFTLQHTGSFTATPQSIRYELDGVTATWRVTASTSCPKPNLCITTYHNVASYAPFNETLTNQTKDYDLTSLKAPVASGNYTEKWQMYDGATPVGTPYVLTLTVNSGISVTVTPSPVSVQTSKTQQFKATVSGSANQAVTWYVNNIQGGNATVGTISAAGLYTAPAAVPSPEPLTVKATSQADATKSGTASLTVTAAPISITISPTPVGLKTSAKQQFAVTCTNCVKGYTLWVNGVQNGNATFGTITAGGLYTAPASVPSPATFDVIAKSVDDSAKTATAVVTITPVTGTINVNSENSVSHQGIAGSWTIGGPAGTPCNPTACTGTTGSYTVPADGVSYTLAPGAAPAGYAFDAAQHENIAEQTNPFIAFFENVLHQAQAEVICGSFDSGASQCPRSAITLSNAGDTANFIINWDPLAKLVVSTTTVTVPDTSPYQAPAVTVNNGGTSGSTLSWNASITNCDGVATSTCKWMQITNTSGSNVPTGGAGTQMQITANAAGLPLGTYTATVTLSGTSLPCDNSAGCSHTAAGSGQAITITFKKGVLICPADGVPPCVPPPTCTFTANPTSVIVPESSTLTYNCKNAVSCGTITGSDGTSWGTAQPSGTSTFSVNPDEPTTYSFSCIGAYPGNAGYTASASVSVGVTNPGGGECPPEGCTP